MLRKIINIIRSIITLPEETVEHDCYVNFIFDGKNGIILDYDDKKTLAGFIKALDVGYIDKLLLEELGIDVEDIAKDIGKNPPKTHNMHYPPSQVYINQEPEREE